MSGDDDDFADVMRGVKPLSGRKDVRPRPAPDPRHVSRPRDEDGDTPRFVVEEEGERVYARRQDVTRRRLAALRAGRTPVDHEIDLHGLDAREAERVLHASLTQAQASGARCVLVIHGAGLHSAGQPVLREALPGWLMRGPQAREVLAFASAPRDHGGSGATLVLLRRPR